jgi:hypothetical protein
MEQGVAQQDQDENGRQAVTEVGKQLMWRMKQSLKPESKRKTVTIALALNWHGAHATDHLP